MLKRAIILLLAVLLLPVLAACSLEKIDTISLPPLPGSEEGRQAAAAAGTSEYPVEPAPEGNETDNAASVLQENISDIAQTEEKNTAEAEPEAVPATGAEEESGQEISEAGQEEQTGQGLQQSEPEVLPETAGQASSSADVSTEQTTVASSAPFSVPVLTVINETKVYDINRYQSIDLRGVIQTDCGVITQVYAVIMNDAGDVIQDCAYYPDSASFNLAGTVNACLRFGDLEPGNYIYQLNASAKNVEAVSAATLAETAFSVISASNQAAETSQCGTGYADQTSGTDGSQEKSEQYSAKLTEDTSNAGQIWNYLVLQLNNPYAAAGILGNIQAESSCLPYVVENDTSKGKSFSISYTESAENGTISRDVFAYSPPGDSLGYGYGLCQWTMDRKGNLYDYAKNSGSPLNSIDTQCGFLMQELYASFPSLLEYLKTCTDAREACRKFCTDYEKAAVWGSRTDDAEEYLEKYARN